MGTEKKATLQQAGKGLEKFRRLNDFFCYSQDQLLSDSNFQAAKPNLIWPKSWSLNLQFRLAGDSPSTESFPEENHEIARKYSLASIICFRVFLKHATRLRASRQDFLIDCFDCLRVLLQTSVVRTGELKYLILIRSKSFLYSAKFYRFELLKTQYHRWKQSTGKENWFTRTPDLSSDVLGTANRTLRLKGFRKAFFK